MNQEQKTQKSRLQQVNHFSGTNGERIEEHKIIDQENNESEQQVQYNGVVTLVANVITPMIDENGQNQGFTGRQIPHDVRFSIDGASTPQEALDGFVEAFQKFQEEMMEIHRQAMEESEQKSSDSQIVVPTPEESKSINRIVHPNE